MLGQECGSGSVVRAVSADEEAFDPHEVAARVGDDEATPAARDALDGGGEKLHIPIPQIDLKSEWCMLEETFTFVLNLNPSPFPFASCDAKLHLRPPSPNQGGASSPASSPCCRPSVVVSTATLCCTVPPCSLLMQTAGPEFIACAGTDLAVDLLEQSSIPPYSVFMKVGILVD
ncbi:hypothetical protein VNO77_16644 [Canavalia gladiata]|uniref:Uncharacterized protein n=1 Tax=Canavalia gladiata TaxID=3824 RepID=A0AAN9LL12_CANGL